MSKLSDLKHESPKKYQKEVEKANKFYDTHKAGKKDPKTGITYHNISATDPRKSKIGSGATLTHLGCPNCDNGLSIKRHTVMLQCSQCSASISVSIDKITDEVTLNVK